MSVSRDIFAEGPLPPPIPSVAFLAMNGNHHHQSGNRSCLLPIPSDSTTLILVGTRQWAAESVNVNFNMKTFPMLVFALVCCLSGLAADNSQIHPLPPEAVSARSAAEHIRPQAVYQQAIEFVLPELILGGGGNSVIKLTNRSIKSIPPTKVYFVDNFGK